MASSFAALRPSSNSFVQAKENLMTRNVGTIDRALRVVFGLLLMGWAMNQPPNCPDTTHA